MSNLSYRDDESIPADDVDWSTRETELSDSEEDYSSVRGSIREHWMFVTI
jgi:hypothetical protein